MNTSLINKLFESDGKIFSAIYTKKDGSTRKIVARIGVKKGITGKGMAYNPIERGLLPVYDMQKKAFRMINVNTLSQVNMDGQVYE